MTRTWLSAAVVFLAVETTGAFSFRKPSSSSVSDRTATTGTRDAPPQVKPSSFSSDRTTTRDAPPPSRRAFLSGATASAFSAAAALLLNPSQAQAKDDLYKPNPLTNGVLEQIRIWEQAEADDLKYDGELAPGDAGNKGKTDAYPRLLVPILKIANEIEAVNSLVRNPDGLVQAQTILKNPVYEKLAFKKIFNAYGDNIYYSDPERANAYLGGGATPKNEQSLAYLLRNDILSNVEALQAEVDYLIKHPEEDTADLFEYASIAKTASQKYLGLVPPGELQKAKELLATSS